MWRCWWFMFPFAEFQRFGDHEVEISQNIRITAALRILSYIGSAVRMERIDYYFCAVGQARHCKLLVHMTHSRACFPRAFDVVNRHLPAGYVLIWRLP